MKEGLQIICLQQLVSVWNNELYQLKVDLGMLDTVKIYWADAVWSVNPSSEQKKKLWRRVNALNVSSVILHGV